jgi:UTP--glucose-1-phosphate uridylyltransferase
VLRHTTAAVGQDGTMTTPTPAVRKAVIPAAGLGTRFLPATKSQPKEMLPVVDKPAIQYVVEEAVRAGIDDILIITGRGKHAIEDHFDRSIELEVDLEAKGKDDLLDEVVRLADLAQVHYVRQGEALGLGHAVGTARRHVGDEPFVVMLGDDIMHERSTVLDEMIQAHHRTGSSIIAVKQFPREEVRAYGVIDPADDADVESQLVRIKGMVEKPAPEDAPSTLAIMGRYVLTPEIFDAIDRVAPGAGGEIQLTDAIALLLADQDVHGFRFSEGRYDIGSKLDYLRATVELALERDDLGPDFRAWLGAHLGGDGAG